MSFSMELKRELVKLPLYPQERKPMAWGLLLDADVFVAEGRAQIGLGDEEVAHAAQKLLASAFGRTPEIKEQVSFGNKRYFLSLVSASAVRYVEQLDEGNLPQLAVSDDRINTFLRGAMISIGTVNQPQKACHLEFYFKHAGRARLLYPILMEILGIPGMANRKGGVGLYYKNSNTIEEIFAVLGANEAFFTLVNRKIETELRNGENRATNCVTNNIKKSVNATQRQLAAVRYIRANDTLWASLPEDLRETATLRLENESATMAELALMHEPAISKSGLNHRLQKLMDIAAEHTKEGADAPQEGQKTEETEE